MVAALGFSVQLHHFKEQAGVAVGSCRWTTHSAQWLLHACLQCLHARPFPLCRASADSLGGLMGLPEGSATFPSSPFKLPQAYVAAWEAKMKSAAEVRAAVKTVRPEGGAGAADSLSSLRNCC